jgi:hypothetical protein
MAHPNAPRPASLPNTPDPAELLSSYLRHQAEAHAHGLPATWDSEVVPHEAGPVQPIDPRLAWGEAGTAVSLLAPETALGALKAPPFWPSLVAGHESVAALALSAGNFPQLVRDLHALLHGSDLTALRPRETRPTAVPGVAEWAAQAVQGKAWPQVLLAVGMLRLAKLFDQAAALLDEYEADVPASMRTAWSNEKAALVWHRGDTEAALALWNAQPASVAVHFNRGMASLFLGDAASGRAELARAVAGLHEESSWYHLGRLYLALAESR